MSIPPSTPVATPRAVPSAADPWPDDPGLGYAPRTGGVWAASAGQAGEDSESAPRLLVDVGGMYLRFALQWPDRLDFAATLVCAEWPGLEEATLAVLQRVFPDDPLGQVRHAVFAVANPVTGDFVALTNHPWRFSVSAMRRNLCLQTLLVVNDFAAMAMALVDLQPGDTLDLGGGPPQPRQVRAVMGPGTGLGMAGLLPVDERWTVLSSEGGHVPYAPHNALEALAVVQVQSRYGHPSAERLLSASGLELLFDLCCTLERTPGRVAHLEILEPAAAAQMGLAGREALATSGCSAREIAALAQARRPQPQALQAIALFCGILGSVAGNLALTLGSLGGVYLAGGMLPHWADLLPRSGFRDRFTRKGRFAAYLAPVSTQLIVAPHGVFRGLSALLADHLRQEHGTARVLLDVREAYPRLSVSEKKVAGDLLSAPRPWLRDPIAQIARRCQVSAPTVLRFCRSLGYQGLSEFKLRLGAGLAVAPVALAAATPEDTAQTRLQRHVQAQCAALQQQRQRLDAAAFDALALALAGLRHGLVLAPARQQALSALALELLAAPGGAVLSAPTSPAAQQAVLAALAPGDALLALALPAGTPDDEAWDALATAWPDLASGLRPARARGVRLLALGLPPGLEDATWLHLAWLQTLVDDGLLRAASGVSPDRPGLEPALD
ncbi:glucokinase [Amphibiibacter pelophylacis]|uniref:Glucokinase n=1 Tax=Amphibiibacter pelophylacis TaxID=1799477 RepID=A0ACC6NY39_9BURK